MLEHLREWVLFTVCQLTNGSTLTQQIQQKGRLTFKCELELRHSIKSIHKPTLDVDWNGPTDRLPGDTQSSSSLTLSLTPVDTVRIPQLPMLRHRDSGTTP